MDPKIPPPDTDICSSVIVTQVGTKELYSGIVWDDSDGRTSISPGQILLTRTFVRAKFHAAVFAILFTLQVPISSV